MEQRLYENYLLAYEEDIVKDDKEDIIVDCEEDAILDCNKDTVDK